MSDYCAHEWKIYKGFREEYEYCVHCDLKRPISPNDTTEQYHVIPIDVIGQIFYNNNNLKDLADKLSAKVLSDSEKLFGSKDEY